MESTNNLKEHMKGEHIQLYGIAANNYVSREHKHIQNPKCFSSQKVIYISQANHDYFRKLITNQDWSLNQAAINDYSQLPACVTLKPRIVKIPETESIEWRRRRIVRKRRRSSWRKRRPSWKRKNMIGIIIDEACSTKKTHSLDVFCSCMSF